jgi:hypothetical protein
VRKTEDIQHFEEHIEALKNDAVTHDVELSRARMDNSQLHERMHSQQQQHAGSMQQVPHPGFSIACCYQAGCSGS